ncbi:MAG: type II toxin-antitoxin system prevent-host-death family antitoxin [Oscillospiraceae bacterium]|nr:type II toxin-antitoxin system prevent-host-death family antitoxin [Oscillospiraceae bacterium]
MLISVSELKKDVDKYVALAETQEVIVTKDGNPVAKIMSADATNALSLESVLRALPIDVDVDAANVEDQLGRLYPTLNIFADFVGVRSGKERGYADRMRRYLEIVLKDLAKRDHYKDDIASWDTNLLLLSTQLHDVGEAAVTESFLKKTGELTEEEFNEIKVHTELGIKIVKQAEDTLDLGTMFRYAEIMAGSHHEKWDGSGYPLGLKADEIPLQGRIMAIVDVYNALTTDRPHREKKTHKEAVEIIKNGSGTHFDPGLVEAFVEHESEFMKVRDESK